MDKKSEQHVKRLQDGDTKEMVKIRWEDQILDGIKRMSEKWIER